MFGNVGWIFFHLYLKEWWSMTALSTDKSFLGDKVWFFGILLIVQQGNIICWTYAHDYLLFFLGLNFPSSRHAIINGVWWWFLACNDMGEFELECCWKICDWSLALSTDNMFFSFLYFDWWKSILVE